MSGLLSDERSINDGKSIRWSFDLSGEVVVDGLHVVI